MKNLEELISDAIRIAQTDLYPARCRDVIAELLFALDKMRRNKKNYMVNIRNGQIVGTDSPDIPDGTYMWSDNLPSKGGKLFLARAALTDGGNDG